MSRRNLLVASVVYTCTILAAFTFTRIRSPNFTTPDLPRIERQAVPKEIEPGPYTITHRVPDHYFLYHEVIAQMGEWRTQAPEITELGIYGQNRKGTDLCYLAIGKPGTPKILVHGAIHGDERLSTACILGFMGQMLYEYKRNDVVTELLRTRQIYFVPVFSPESYLKSREIEGGDPNRNWPYPVTDHNNRASPVLAMQQWFAKMKFCAVIDGHTYGRLFFWPAYLRGKDQEVMRELATDMAGLAKYSPQPVPLRNQGLAIDWYSWQGATAMVVEFGADSTRKHDFPISAIEPEFNRTYPAIILFIREAPEVRLSREVVQPVEYEFPAIPYLE